jgi:hypothetical protein
MPAMAPPHPQVKGHIDWLIVAVVCGTVPPIDLRRVDRHRVSEVIGVANEVSPERW